MGAPTTERLGIVKALIETAPDGAVKQLNAALQGAPGGDLAAVRDMIESEVWERQVRDAVFAPLTRLFVPRADGFEQILFPAVVLPKLWGALKKAHPKAVTIAIANLNAMEGPDSAPPVYDQLCREAAAGLRTRDPAFARVIELLDAQGPGLAQQLAGFLAISPLARKATARLPAWIRNMNNEHVAAVRVLFKDAVAVSDDAA